MARWLYEVSRPSKFFWCHDDPSSNSLSGSCRLADLPSNKNRAWLDINKQFTGWTWTCLRSNFACWPLLLAWLLELSWLNSASLRFSSTKSIPHNKKGNQGMQFLPKTWPRSIATTASLILRGRWGSTSLQTWHVSPKNVYFTQAVFKRITYRRGVQGKGFNEGFCKAISSRTRTSQYCTFAQA